MEEFEKASCIRGFYVYQDNWTPILGERLVCKNEPDNPRDQYAVAVYKSGNEIVGHLPRNIPAICSDRSPLSAMIKKKKFAGKLSRLKANPRKPRKFSAANDLHYTVVGYIGTTK